MQIIGILFMAVGALTAITVHEYIKALVSYKLGDPLPKSRGRLTLNPAKHFEVIGFICMIVTGYGWGNPVETAPVYYKDRKRGTILTYVTPSVVNLLIGIVFAFVSRLMLGYITALGEGANTGVLVGAYSLMRAIARFNVALALFNIIPVYPLDGAKILSLMLSPNRQVKMASYEKIFQIILVIAMFTGWVGMLLSPLQAVFVR